MTADLEHHVAYSFEFVEDYEINVIALLLTSQNRIPVSGGRVSPRVVYHQHDQVSCSFFLDWERF